MAGSPQHGIVLKKPLTPGGVALIGLTGIPPGHVPAGAVRRSQPRPTQRAITGVVWRDFKPGGGTPGKVEPQELGLPGVKVDLRDAVGEKVGTATTEDERDVHVRGREAGGLPGRVDAGDVRASRSAASPGSARS